MWGWIAFGLLWILGSALLIKADAMRLQKPTNWDSLSTVIMSLLLYPVGAVITLFSQHWCDDRSTTGGYYSR